MHLTKHITQKKEKKKQYNANFMGFRGMTQNVILCATDTTLHFKNKPN